MCQIFYCPRGEPSKEILQSSWEHNDDGGGMAWIDEGKVQFVKGYSIFEDFYSVWRELPLPKVAHFRFATHGGVCQELTHPFPLTPSAGLALRGAVESVLFHNGVFAAFEPNLRTAIFSGQLRVPRGPLSDSRAMAMLAGRFGKRVLDLLQLGGDRVLVLDSSGSAERWGVWQSEDNLSWYHSSPLDRTHRVRQTSGPTTGYQTLVPAANGSGWVWAEE